MIEAKYKELCKKPSDINEHLPTLKRYASEVDHITEMGVRWVVSTWAFLAGNPKKLISYDINNHPNIEEVKKAADNFEFIRADVLKVEIEETDLLFLDTWHCDHQLRAELKLHADKVRRYLILHDTTTFGQTGEDGGKGLKIALDEFLEADPNWVIKKEFTNNNGLTILERVSSGKPKKEIKKAEPFKFEFGKKLFNKSKKVKFIIPLPDVPYYLWQALVQINNFTRYGYDIDAHYLVGCFNGNVSKRALSIFASDKIKSKVHFYHDTRHDVKYEASLKPYLMSRYFKDFPKEKDSIYVYLDPDVIFLEDFDFSKYINDDIWYESNTISYLDTKYINSKGDGLLEDMCESFGIEKSLVENNDSDAGGAQYITKNNTFELWDEVWRKSIDLFHVMAASAKKYKGQWKEFPIQKWTSEMWTTNWSVWGSGITTKVITDLDFNWANHLTAGPRHKIFHNAGVTANDGKHFSKTSYQSSPWRKEVKCSEKSMSYFYKMEVISTEERFSEIIWK